MAPKEVYRDNKEVVNTAEFQERKQLQKLREICSSQFIPSQYQRTLFENFFPSELSIELFDSRSVEFSDETKLSNKGRKIRRTLMKYLGYKPRSKAASAENLSSDDVPEFDVFFRNSTNTFLYDLNHLPIFERLQNVAQLDPRYTPHRSQRRIEIDPQFLSRADHTKHLAKLVTYSIFRLALRQPKEFIEKVKQDLLQYSLKSNNAFIPHEEELFHLSKKERRKITKLLQAHGIKKSDPIHTAISTAFGYSKYLITFAYLHDIATPALGDIFMKTKDKNGSSAAIYSEDEILQQDISLYLDDNFGYYTGLPYLAAKHRLNKDLLEIMVKQLASEGDKGLGGMLMKYKRKYKTDEYPESDLNGEASYDLDQESGTITNAKKWINSLVENGCRYFDPNKPLPIGSFEERLRFFTFLHITGKTKDETKTILDELGIDIERMYIAIEEFTAGQNTALRKYETAEHFDYELVISRPADAKKALTMLSVNYLFFYRASYRAAIESLIQTAISTGLQESIFSKDLFINRGDYDALNQLQMRFPIIPFFLRLIDQGAILTNEEFKEFSSGGAYLWQKVTLGGVLPQKKGTLVADENKFIVVIDSILNRHRLNHHMEKPFSLPKRLKKIKDFIEQSAFYFVIPLTIEQTSDLSSLLGDDRLSEDSRTAMQKVLLSWKYTNSSY